MKIQASAPVAIAPGLAVRLPTVVAGRRQSHDSIAGCRERAADDLAQAAMISVVNGRSRLEHSAATWIQRADLLEQRELRHQARIAAGGRS
jgi:hypothetical protein